MGGNGIIFPRNWYPGTTQHLHSLSPGGEEPWLLSAGLPSEFWPWASTLGRVSWEGANQRVERKA